MEAATPPTPVDTDTAAATGAEAATPPTGEPDGTTAAGGDVATPLPPAATENGPASVCAVLSALKQVAGNNLTMNGHKRWRAVSRSRLRTAALLRAEPPPPPQFHYEIFLSLSLLWWGGGVRCFSRVVARPPAAGRRRPRTNLE